MKKGHLLLIIILLIMIICGILIYLKNSNTELPIDEIQIGGVIEKVTDRNNYYMVKNCVDKFYNYYIAVYENKNPEEKDIEKLYNLLDKQYIDYKHITQENLPTILSVINESVVNVYDMYFSNQNESISVYIVNGNLRDVSSKELNNFTLMIKIDKKNETFSVFMQDYILEKHKDINIGSNLIIEDVNNIGKNKNNIYVLEEITNKTYMLDLFKRYKEEALYNTELAYENLDEEYKNTKFGTLEKFRDFIKQNEITLKNIELEKYQVSDKEIYKQYIGIDKEGHYYIFREIGLMEYTLILDTYTIDLPEFLEKYNVSVNVEKVGYNIQKCIEAINNKDYEYVYNKLDFEFKAVNYPIIENFEKEIKAKLFDRNEVKKVKSYNEGSTYAYKMTITDVNNNEKEQDITVIMQLKEGTDFVMSFSFE